MVHRFVARSPRGARTGLLIVALALVACSRNPAPDTDVDDVSREPIAIHVKNENFLDVNVAVVAGGLSRRLGQVTGNGSGDFTITWSVVNGQQIVLTATPIGGSQRYTSQGLSIGPGQMVEFRIGSVLRQSSAIVREP